MKVGMRARKLLIVILALIFCLFITGLITIPDELSAKQLKKPEPISNKRKAAISVVIPVTAPELTYRCLFQVIASFQIGPVLPAEIILIISGYDAAYDPFIKEIREFLEDNYWSDSVKIVKYEEANFAGANRNRGLVHSKSEIVTFIDADDLPHPQRIEILEKVMESYPQVDLLLHGFVPYGDIDFFKDFGFPDYVTDFNISNSLDHHWEFYTPNQKKWYQDHMSGPDKGDGSVPYCCILEDGDIPVANGWPTVRKRALKHFRYQEWLRTAEDVHFNMQLVWSGGNLTTISRFKLGYYNRMGEKKSLGCRKSLQVLDRHAKGLQAAFQLPK